MTDGRHKASVTIDAKVDAADRNIGKLTRRINKMESALERANKSANKKGDSIRRIQVQSTSAVPALDKMVQGLGAAGVAGAAGLATAAVVSLVTHSEQLADTAIQTQAVFRNLTISIEPARSATMGFVGDMELAKAAAQATSLGVSENSRDFAELAGALSKLGQSKGLTALDGIESGIAAIGRGSTEMLDNLGITLKVSQAQAEYAKQLGVSTAALTEEQKAAAFGVIAKQKVIDAARDIEITTDGAASAVKRFHVELDNLETRALGGGKATRGLAEALVELDREQKVSIDQVQTYGSELLELEGRLVDMGVAYSDLTGDVQQYVKILRFARKEETRRKNLQFLEDRKKPFEDFGPALTPEVERGIETHQNKQRLRDIRLETAALEGSSKAHQAISDLKTEQAELNARNAELSGDLEKAEDIRFENELRLLRETGKEAKSAHREVKSLLQSMLEADKRRLSSFDVDVADMSFLDSGTVDPFSVENKQIYLDELARLAEEERAIEHTRRDGLLQDEILAVEMQREMGVDPIVLLEREQAARLAHNDFLMQQADGEAAVLALKNDRRRIYHEAEMKRMQIERREQQRQMQVYQQVGDTIGQVYQATAAAAIASAFQQGQSVREAVKSSAKAEAVRSGITALSSFVQAAFWSAVPGGQAAAAHFTAAGIKASAAAVSLGALAGSLSGTPGGGGGGRKTGAPQLGVGAANVTRPQQSLPGAQGGAGASSTVPPSPTGRPGGETANQRRGEQSAGGVNLSGATVHLYGVPEGDFLDSVDRGLRRRSLQKRT